MKHHMQHTTNQKGFVVTLVTFFVLIIMVTMSVSMSSLIFSRQKIATNSVKSTQSYYTAEAGIEDVLLRLKTVPQLSPTTYTLTVGSASTTVTVPAIVGGARTLTSEGNDKNIKRKIQVVYSVDSQGVSFFYGAQVGDGGLVMNNNSRVQGNVFSTGNISGGNGTIDNNVIVAGNGHYIDDVRVKGNAQTYSCLSPSVIEGNLTYVTGGTRTCTVQGAISTQTTEIPTQPLPISQAQIDEWKADALVGGTSGDVTVSGQQTLGPKKIQGKLTLNNNATLTITGTLHVTDEIVLNNGSTLKLDSSYGSIGGVVVSDGKITLNNNSSALGSGQSGSYMLLLSTNTADPAIDINNNGTGAIFYTSAGGIRLNNNAQVKELTGYKITLQNNAVIAYESGLANAFFSAGPSGGWTVQSWEEK